MRRHPRLLAAGLALALALLAGCGGNPKPKTLPSPSPSPSPTATSSATPTPPVMPAAAMAKTKAGAIAFADWYVKLINHAQATGDTQPLADVESPRCQTCEQSRKALEAVYASGATVTGGDWKIVSAQTLRNPSTRGWLVALIISFGRQIVDKPGSADDQILKGGRLPVNLQVTFSAGAWKVLECTRGA